MYRVTDYHFNRFIFVACVIIALFLFLGNIFSKQKDISNCDDFRTYAQVLRAYRRHPSDPYHLDRDNDGIPCENLLRFEKS